LSFQFVAHAALFVLTTPLAGATTMPSQKSPANVSIDPEHIYIAHPVENPVAEVIEPIPGSDIPQHLLYIETIDGLYAPIGLRKPPGKGPFPIVLFAHMNGGLGTQWIREWAQNGSWTLERFLEAGYAVAWMRYRAEVKEGYGTPLIEGKQEGRQIFNRGAFEYEDAIAIIKFVKTLAYIDANRVGYFGLSHGGEMLMKIASEYHGLRAGIASEPASIDYLAVRPQKRKPGAKVVPETLKVNTEEMQRKAVKELRRQIDMAAAMKRIKAVTMPIFVQGRDRDHHQDIFRLNYELLHDAGKDVEWKSYDHNEHGFVFVKRNRNGDYEPDAIQLRAVKDSIEYFDQKMKETQAKRL
jgi:dienelactone hydrolase